MPADSQPDLAAKPARAAKAADPANKEDRSAGAFATRVLLGLAGLGLLSGFFMPWIRFGNTLVLSGFSLWASSGDAVEIISGPRRALLFAVPLSGAALMVSAYFGYRTSIWIALLASIVLLGYGAFTILKLFLDTTGAGMWLVVGCAMLAFAIALIGFGRRTKA